MFSGSSAGAVRASDQTADSIKKIGTAAREELEKFFDRKVFLDLHVRVKSEWREDERVLGEIGLGGNE